MSSETTAISIEQFRSALEDLTDENINSVLGQLHNSLSKLAETNEYLQNEIGTDADPESRRLYEETIRENVGVMESQRARVAAIEAELARRESKGGKAEEEGIYL